MTSGNRRVRHRARVAGASILVAAGLVGLVGCGGSGGEATTVVVTETVGADSADPTTTEAAPIQDVVPAPAPMTLTGSGMRIVTVNIARSTPTVIAAKHTGSSNFIVEVLGEGGEMAINEIGSFRGQVVLASLAHGRHRVKVDADGAWSLRFTQPNPPANATAIPGSLSGKGQAVMWIRANEDESPIITGHHRGDSNFIVDIHSADGAGDENLFNEIGPFSGETTTDIPAGDYLVSVVADGSWSLRFAR